MHNNKLIVSKMTPQLYSKEQKKIDGKNVKIKSNGARVCIALGWAKQIKNGKGMNGKKELWKFISVKDETL